MGLHDGTAAEYRGGLVEADGVAAQSRGAGSLQSRGTAADDRHGLRGHRRCHHEFKLTNAGGVDRTECRLIAVEKRHALRAGDAPADLIQTALSGLQQQLRVGVQAAGDADEIDFACSQCSFCHLQRGEFARRGDRMVTADLMAAARSTRAPGAASIGG